MSTLSSRYQQLLASLADLRRRFPDRVATDLEILAVSKRQPVEAIIELFRLGARAFAENYCDELEEKRTLLGNSCPGIKICYIGQLQSNKIQRIVRVADEIQTAASIRHCRYIARYARELGKTPFPIYLAVNLGNEPQKGGVQAEEALALAQVVREDFAQSLTLRGLMCIPPIEISDQATKVNEPSEVPDLYRQFVHLARAAGEGKASIGMSADWQAAALAGSRCVRVGTSLFGARPTEP